MLARLLASLFVLYISGCGDAKTRTDETPQAYVSVKLLRTEPAYLSEIKPDTAITLYFQGVPIDFTSSTGDVILKGQTVTFTVRKSDFIRGRPLVTIRWRTERKGRMKWKRLTIEDDDLQTLTWTSKALPGPTDLMWKDAIETDGGGPEKNMPVKFLRSEPPVGSWITDTDTIILYFQNRPKHVKIMKYDRHISQAIVKGNTVEISPNPQTRSRSRKLGGQTSFWVKWTDDNQYLYYKNFVPPEDRPTSFLRADPPGDSSIRAIDTVVLYFDAVPFDVEIPRSPPNVGPPIVRGKTVEIPITHPIRERSLGFSVVWWSESKRKYDETSLYYKNPEVESKNRGR